MRFVNECCKFAVTIMSCGDHGSEPNNEKCQQDYRIGDYGTHPLATGDTCSAVDIIGFLVLHQARANEKVLKESLEEEHYRRDDKNV